MPLFGVLLWSLLPDLGLLSGPDLCGVHESSSSQIVSPLLESLQCYNDYNTHVHCQWRKHRNTTLQLWFETGNGRYKEWKLCLPYNATDAAEHKTVHCRYKAPALAIGIEHTGFFSKNKTLSICSSVKRKSLNLHQHLRARPPVNLSTHDAGDGGQRLRWSSPYPPSSSLNNNLTYQLSYRTHGQDSWTTEDATKTSVKLESQLLLPGRRYEARVRARATVGHWSNWSPVVTWQKEEDFGQHPTLHCVLHTEREVMCSWEVSRELAHFITYQLACQQNQTAPPERCCVNPKVSSELDGMVLRYSCSLTVADPEHLLLDLQPMHSTKTFKTHQHIRTNPPQQVKVGKKGSNWVVEWMKPSTFSEVQLYYQVCYFRAQDQGSSVLKNTSEGSTSLTIQGSSLRPSQDYQVKVRSVIFPGWGFTHKGIPSEWTDPVDWTSDKATWSYTTLIYFLVSAFVTLVFLSVYCTFPACQRKVILWVDSIPSPGKSKSLSEIKSSTGWTLIQSEKTSICKVQQLGHLSTGSSDVLLWPSKDIEKKCLDQDEGCWNCDNLPSPAEEVTGSDTSSMSFSGPYIFCQSSEPTLKPVNIQNEDKDTEASSDASASPSPVNFALYGEGYVCLPRQKVSTSTQDLVFHGDGSTSTHWHNTAEEDQQRVVVTLKSDSQPGLSEPTSEELPPEYSPGPFTPWPQGSTIQASGYCHLPMAFMRGAE